ncbi:IS630 transposase-related protein [Neisseria iguanae]|uniref:Transposase Synechocystis PCC 6803 domain-containing protein n=1 Tax=Neisseria iguanae TaxID=90242 RepID=A0A2P7TWV9_9NEIS|nr:hypothetical protein C7N83_13855 [Neisseria iguanae]
MDRARLPDYPEKHPGACLSEMTKVFNSTPPALFYALKSLEITRKKRRLPTQNKIPQK